MTTPNDLVARLSRLERQTALAEAYSIEAFWSALDVSYDIALSHRPLRCIVCDRTGLRSDFEILISRCMFGGGKLERYRCPTCECVFGPQKYLDLIELFVDRHYQLLYSRYSEFDLTFNEIKTFNSLRPTLSGPYLDWGCGGAWSHTIAELRREGWDVWGYEPSAETAGNFVVNQRDSISARFEGIFSNNVIEHFRDPVAQFTEFHSLLKEGGSMAHSSPCYEYSYPHTRFHTLFLLGRSPQILAERTGFRVSSRVQDGEYINCVFART